MKIDREFAIASTETTIEQFERFLADPKVKAYYGDQLPSFTGRYVGNVRCPQISVSWMDVILYCQWLTEQEEFPESDHCFPGILGFPKRRLAQIQSGVVSLSR